MVENVIHIKGEVTNVNVSVKNQQSITYAIKIKLGILVNNLLNVLSIVILINIYKNLLA